MAGTSSRPRRAASATTSSILDAGNGRELLRLTNDGASWAPVWSPTGDAIAFLHIRGQIVDLKLVRLDGDAPDWTVKDIIDLTEVSGLDGESRPGWFVPADELPGRDAGARRLVGPERQRFRRAPVTEPYLERLAARTAAVGSVLCLGLDPDPRGLPAGFSADVAGVERFAGLLDRGGRAVRRGDQAEPRLLRGARVARAGRPRADPGADPGRHPGRHRRQAGRHRIDCGTPRGRPVRRPRRRRGHGQPVPRRPRRSRRSSSASTATPTSCAGRRTPSAAEFQNLVVAADPAIDAPAEPLHLRVARHVATWGPGGTVGLVVGATAPAELAAIRAVAPGLGFLVPGIGAQGGDIEPVLRDGPATAAPAGPGRGGGLLVNVSRGIGDAALETPGDGGPRDPGERLAAAARDWASRLPVLP